MLKPKNKLQSSLQLIQPRHSQLRGLRLFLLLAVPPKQLQHQLRETLLGIRIHHLTLQCLEVVIPQRPLVLLFLKISLRFGTLHLIPHLELLELHREIQQFRQKDKHKHRLKLKDKQFEKRLL